MCSRGGDGMSDRDPNRRRRKMQDMLNKHYKKRGLIPPKIKPKIDWDKELSKLPRRIIGEE